MEKRVLVPLAEGFEMVEALAVVDVFRRGGVLVETASLEDSLEVTSSHGVTVKADRYLSECQNESYDLIVLPGGIPGAEKLRDSEMLREILKAHVTEQKLYGAICASPALVLEHHGLLAGKSATCHPLFAEKLEGASLATEAVVADGNCVTGRGAGSSIEFGLELLEQLCGKEKRREVAKTMALPED